MVACMCMGKRQKAAEAKKEAVETTDVVVEGTVVEKKVDADSTVVVDGKPEEKEEKKEKKEETEEMKEKTEAVKTEEKKEKEPAAEDKKEEGAKTEEVKVEVAAEVKKEE